MRVNPERKQGLSLQMGMMLWTKWILSKHATSEFNRKIAKRFSHTP